MSNISDAASDTVLMRPIIIIKATNPASTPTSCTDAGSQIRTFYLAYLFQDEQLTSMLVLGSLVTLAGIALTIIGGGEQRNIDFQPARPPEPPAEEISP